MCFSATGSFTVSGILVGIGAASLAHASPQHRLFAAIPLIFAAQQATEGVVWLTMMPDSDARLHQVAVNLFLAFALVVWPTWFPFSLQRMEQRWARRRFLAGLSVVGVAVSTYAALLLLRLQPIARVAGHSIQYDLRTGANSPNPLFFVAAYALPTIVPFFVSTGTLSRTIGIVLIGSMLATMIIQRNALTSVWCFFAAILSGLMYMAIRRRRLRALPSTILASEPS